MGRRLILTNLRDMDDAFLCYGSRTLNLPHKSPKKQPPLHAYAAGLIHTDAFVAGGIRGFGNLFLKSWSMIPILGG